MKKIKNLFYKLICLFILVSSGSIFAQDYSKVDETVKAYPESFSSLEKLADKINKDFTTDVDKARAIYTWMALHISYDLNEAKNLATKKQVAFSFRTEEEKLQKQLQYRQDMALRTLKSKRGVCQNYAALFHGLCDLTGLKCLDITGTSKVHPVHIGKLPQLSDHMWNAVKIGDSWELVDVTWAAGSVDGKTGKFVQKFNSGYFMTDPMIFYLNHFPDDPKLAMVQKTPQDWAQLPLFYGEYIKNPFPFEGPATGILSNLDGNILPFKITGLTDGDRISYSFSSENKYNEAQLKRTGNDTEFEITLTPRARGFLTVFLNNKSLVSYKL